MDPELEKLFKDHPVAVIGMCLLGYIVLQQPSGKKRPDVPGLYGPTNSAWRGPGSFGKAPFGKQIGHRR